MKKRTIIRLISVMLALFTVAPLIFGCNKRGETDNTTAQDGGSTTSPDGGTTPPDETSAQGGGEEPSPGELPSLEDWTGVGIKSSGSKEGNAAITGRGISVEYDEDEGKNVLRFRSGDALLELPANVFENAKSGFSVALRIKPAEGCASGAKLFQTNLCGYGVGDTQWHDAPEISLAADGTVRVYVGGRTINGTYTPNATYNNGGAGDDKAYAEPGGHKTRYSATSSPVGAEWTDIVISVSTTALTLYVNGTAVELKDTSEGGVGDIASTLAYLFGSDGGDYILGQYVNTSVSGGVYGDVPNFTGLLSGLRIYESALSDADAKSLPDGAAYVWDFDAADIVLPDGGDEVESDLTKYNGKTDVTAVSELTVSSPNGENKVEIRRDADGGFYYSITSGKTVVIENSAIGFETRSGKLVTGLSVADGSVKTQEINEKYTTVTGPSDEKEDHCNELRFTLSNGDGSFDFVIRVFDDGVAYKYENVTVGSGDSLVVTDEKSEYILPHTTVTWGYAPTGTYEGEYVRYTYEQLEKYNGKFSTSMLAKRGSYWMMFTEANVFNNNGDFCASALVTTNGKASLDWSFGVDRDNNNKAQLGELGRPGHFDINSITTRNGFSTPWRVAVISDDLEELALSTIITDLNPDPDPELYADTSYIKPGRVAWSWWAEENDQGNYNKHVEYIDFASENGWEYVCLDANWRNFEPRIADLCAYAKEKGVGLFVWINYLDMIDDDEMERLFSAWSAAGVVGLKTDYFESDAQNVLEVMRKSAICAAKHHLMILYHGCPIPYGEARTFPNILSTEAVQGEENHKWSAVPTIENCLLYPFTRNVCGSMDYTPATTRIPVNGTSNGFGLAMTVVYESGLQHLANAAAVYKTYAGLSFLNNLKVDWDESKLVEGYPGEYVSFARRSGEDWYLGSMTLYARTAEYKLDFLGDGEYNAYIYGDNEDGTVLVVEEKKVKSSDTLKFDLIDGGGVAVIITKKTIDTKVEGAEEMNDPNYTYYEAESSNNTLAGAAVRQMSVFCSSMQKVGYVGNGAANTLTFNGVKVDKDGEYTLRLWYCCGENRKVELTVNGGEKYTLENLNSGDYVHTKMVEVKITLKAGENTITLANASYYAPDIDRIAISKTAD